MKKWFGAAAVLLAACPAFAGELPGSIRAAGRAEPIKDDADTDNDDDAKAGEMMTKMQKQGQDFLDRRSRNKCRLRSDCPDKSERRHSVTIRSCAIMPFIARFSDRSSGRDENQSV